MTMQQSHSRPDAEEIQTRISQLRPVGLSGKMTYRSFGALLASIRKDAHLTQTEVAAEFPRCFTARSVPIMDENMYGNLERGRRYPSFAELQPLYRALTEGSGIVFSAAEREAYLALARKKIEEKGRRREHRLTEADWLQLADELAEFDQSISAE